VQSRAARLSEKGVADADGLVAGGAELGKLASTSIEPKKLMFLLCAGECGSAPRHRPVARSRASTRPPAVSTRLSGSRARFKQPAERESDARSRVARPPHGRQPREGLRHAAKVRRGTVARGN
jgi:hypothetical protein